MHPDQDWLDERLLQHLHESIAAACQSEVDAVARDMRAERFLDAEQARAYGLVDSTGR